MKSVILLEKKMEYKPKNNEELVTSLKELCTIKNKTAQTIRFNEIIVQFIDTIAK